MLHVWNALTDTPKSRYQLTKELGISDRALRRHIHDLRANSYPVYSDSHGRGYKRGSTQEMRQVANELRSRAYDHLETARIIEAMIDSEDQINMEV